jgi:hypothetical protein
MYFEAVIKTLEKSPANRALILEIYRRYYCAHQQEHELYIKDTTRPLPVNLELVCLDMLFVLATSASSSIRKEKPSREGMLLFVCMLKVKHGKSAILASMSARDALRLQSIEPVCLITLQSLCDDILTRASRYGPADWVFQHDGSAPFDE